MERVAALATLAALPAVRAILRVHARQREFERHAELDAQADDVVLVHPRQRRVHHEVVRQPERQRVQEGLPEPRRHDDRRAPTFLEIPPCKGRMDHRRYEVDPTRLFA